VLDHDLGVFSVQFLREDHGDRGVDALTHLSLRDHKRGPAGIVDTDESVWRELAAWIVGRLLRLVDRRGAQRPREGQHKAAREAVLQENPTRKVGMR
jgi:hypothetical protein